MLSAPFRIAICDDAPDSRRLLARQLSEDPRFEVTIEAGPLAEFSRRLAVDQPDAVILDYAMSGVEGADAVRLVAARMRGRPVFVMSSATRHLVERRALAAGATAFFPKDDAARHLVETLHLHLTRAALSAGPGR